MENEIVERMELDGEVWVCYWFKEPSGLLHLVWGTLKNHPEMKSK